MQKTLLALFLAGLALTAPAPLSTKVTSVAAFNNGAGNKSNGSPANNTGNAGSDHYTCYYGGASNFPAQSRWVDFPDMFNANKPILKQGCGDLGISPQNTEQQIGFIWNAIVQVAQESLVDPRFILAVIIQESFGCVHVGATNNGENNPGIMQSDDGVSFVGNSASSSAQQASITQMVIDGTEGTKSGDGLVKGINVYGNIYDAARFYNSGAVDKNNLNSALGATGSYVNDIANRMTGWVYAGSKKC